MHIAHVDAVLPNGHVQRQTLRDGEAGVTKRLTSWQNLIEEQQAIYGMVRRAAGHMAELQVNQQKDEKPSWIAEAISRLRRWRLLQDEAVYLLDTVDAPILARRAIVSAGAALAALGPPQALHDKMWSPLLLRNFDLGAIQHEAVAARIDSVWEHELDAYAQRRHGRARQLTPAPCTEPDLWRLAYERLEEVDIKASAEHEAAFIALLDLSTWRTP